MLKCIIVKAVYLTHLWLQNDFKSYELQYKWIYELFLVIIRIMIVD